MGDVSATEGTLILFAPLLPSLHSLPLHSDSFIPTNPQIGSKMPLIFDTAPLPARRGRRLSGARASLSAHGQVLEFHAGLRVERSLCAPKLRSAPELASPHRRKILRQTCSLPKGVGEVGKSNEGEEGGKEGRRRIVM